MIRFIVTTRGVPYVEQNIAEQCRVADYLRALPLEQRQQAIKVGIDWLYAGIQDVARRPLHPELSRRGQELVISTQQVASQGISFLRGLSEAWREVYPTTMRRAS